MRGATPGAAASLAAQGVQMPRPHYLLAWDANIREALGRPEGSAQDYQHFLKKARKRLKELQALRTLHLAGAAR